MQTYKEPSDLINELKKLPYESVQLISPEIADKIHKPLFKNKEVVKLLVEKFKFPVFKLAPDFNNDMMLARSSLDRPRCGDDYLYLDISLKGKLRLIESALENASTPTVAATIYESFIS